MTKFFRIIIIFLSLCIIVAGFAVGFLSDHANEVALYDTQGSQDSSKWKKITNKEYVFTNPEHIVFENASFRVTYPILREDQQAGHSYWVKVHDEWMRVTGLEYGDYTYFIDSIRKPPEQIAIITNTPEEVTLAFTYVHKNYRAATSTKRTYKGDIELTKIMSLKKDYSGVFVKLQSIPVNPYGEREIGFGISAPLVYGDNVVSQHPLVNHHVPLAMKESQWYYAVSLPLENSFYRILALSRPMLTLAFQAKDPTKDGRIIVNRLVERDEDKYQVFLGAQPYDSSQAILEVETQSGSNALVHEQDASGGQFLRISSDGVQQHVFPLTAPEAGQYRVVLRVRSSQGARLSAVLDNEILRPLEIARTHGFEYFVLSEQQELSAGEHHLTIMQEDGEVDVDNVLVLPLLSPQKSFPLDIFARVFPEMILAQTRFEGEVLHRSTGRNVSDAAASNASARFAEVGGDKADFLVFGPYQRAIVPGTYRVRFYVKVNDNTKPEMAAVLDVHSSLAGVLAQKILKGTDFKNNLEYQEFELECSLPPTYPPKIHRLEFRVFFSGNIDVWVDYVDLIPELAK